MMWWTAPAPGIECHRVIVADESHEGSRPDASYHDRFGYRQERVSGPRHRRQGEGGCEKATPAQPSGSVFQGFAAVPDRNGGVCHRALLGARVEKARPQGAADAGEGCEGLRQAHKNDAADAEAICEAVRRPTMRFVQVKSAE